MRIHRIDALLHWLFTKLALPVLALCLLSQTLKVVQLSDTGLPAAYLTNCNTYIACPAQTRRLSQVNWHITAAFGRSGRRLYHLLFG